MTLEELLKKEIEKIKKGKIDERIVSFVDYKNKYAILKSAVKVEVSLTKGVVATIDISDYFEEEVR